MIKLFAILVLGTLSLQTSAQSVLCVGTKCAPVDATEQRGNGLLGLKKEQNDKLNGVQEKDADKSFIYNKPNERVEIGSGLKLHELEVGQCLILPADSSKYYKIMKIDRKSTLITFVIENEVHDYMLAWNFASWNLPDSNALKDLRIWDCNRTPNLWDNAYVNKCTGKGAASGKLYCDPKKKF